MASDEIYTMGYTLWIRMVLGVSDYKNLDKRRYISFLLVLYILHK